ncbi:MAG: NRDE family protein, partial [Steroidobacteraceae bacterium]
PDAPSRGELVARFLTGAASPKAYLDDLRGRAARYAGFNLLVGGPRALHYLSNRNGQPSRPLEAGVYGLSNHLLDSPWPKVLRTRERFAALLGQPTLDPAELFAMLRDDRPANEDEIPETGLPAELERVLSAPFVLRDDYGTRCSTLLLVERNGRSTMHERRYDAAGRMTGATRLQFDSMEVPERWHASEHEGEEHARALSATFDSALE